MIEIISIQLHSQDLIKFTTFDSKAIVKTEDIILETVFKATYCKKSLILI